MIETILSRKSERDYTGETIPQEDIRKILDCGFHAPSAMNRQPWSVVVTKDKEVFRKIMEFQPYCKFLNEASHAVFVCGDKEKSPHFWRDDCAAVTQNILLGAHGLGYGACWCGITPVPEHMKGAKQLFQLPENIEAYSLIVLGVKKTSREPNKGRYQDSLVHIDKW